MSDGLAKQIRAVWDEVAQEFDDDKSTEFLLEVTAERVRIQKIMPNCDCSDVAEALSKTP